MIINKVAVIGAGVMGAGIAAQIANGGVDVILLDMLADTDRNKLARDAIQTQLKTGGFMHKDAAKRVTPGNLEDHLDWISDCDLILEVIIENLEIKQSLYRKIEKYRKPESIVSSNTSTIPLRQLIEGLPLKFQNDFLITHFFNPPRHMRLLELVASSKSRNSAVHQLTEFCSYIMGKTVINCNDTAGFIANRIGVFWLMTGLHEAQNLAVSVEEADAVIGKVFGIPNTGIFGLFDLVGIDIIPKVAQSLSANLSSSDPFQSVADIPDWVDEMISHGFTGRKGGCGFYRMIKTNQGKKFEVFDLLTKSYRSIQKPDLDSLDNLEKLDARGLMMHSDRGGQYARSVMGKTLKYAASLIPEITDDIEVIDTVMKLGFAWQYGPFELIDLLGKGKFNDFQEDENEIPPILAAADGRMLYQVIDEQYGRLNLSGDFKPIKNSAGVLSLLDIKRYQTPLIQNSAASLWDIDKGIACLEFHSKGNVINREALDMINQSLELLTANVSHNFKGLVFYNEGKQFSSGADLSFILDSIKTEDFDLIEEFIFYGQQTYHAILQSEFPVIAATAGLSLGGGCEVALHCDVVQAHAETYMGLVEPLVGLTPGWGGCKESVKRHVNESAGNILTPDLALNIFKLISGSVISSSAALAVDSQFILDNKHITMNRDHLLLDARTLALSMSDNYTPPPTITIEVQGETIQKILSDKIHADSKNSLITKHDQIVQQALVKILSADGKNTILSEQDFLDLERKAFMQLVRTVKTKERIEHMLTTKKPLRN
ncbi:MAG: 3-hydroxyacyl-CoA dehydrogenase [Gammaproteobacteria bacterium]|jgi:3-hydroxyacyl-CoA dehydrogenase|nr:3-hydroxyacyl-CoA dehydrogenase [Gammaproteobacteria bacterium]MBT3723928.1 3-hydroxyacyl-CoA dehydrogenase [Gammaproteobacteria bacterium]MBT4077308.1 3-hydroxyacyl-CoA dehydrogenase [Gammaproteobacteria bacterium]MBT4193801.1 3-hydroxyacyl-CoA dehydrogenase [Gammaproteobacteria bacterium]MBT4449840.1 3-hydroxyacyl-CoA dehydrogenase [Gammaproteobacteria bacterium]